MNERVQSDCKIKQKTNAKMGPDIGPKKTMIILVVVVGCFAVLWPKVFQPIFFGNIDEQIKPNALDKSTGCCDVYSETDINTLKIMNELCSNIIEKTDNRLINGKEMVNKCKLGILETCGIDISAVLQEKFRFGASVKQILNEVRSLNGSLCLKYNFGVAPWRLGVPHKVLSGFKPTSVRQERPPHLRPDIIHPAFRERGSAITRAPSAAAGKTPPKIVVEGRPGPIPGMRPPMGGAGGVVPPSQKGSSMGIIMPIYTIGIVIFFTYTLMKLVFKKQPNGVGGALYPPVDTDRSFHRDVFESENQPSRFARENTSSKIGDVELDQLRKRLRETEVAMERIVAQMAKAPLGSQVNSTAHLATSNGSLSNGDVKKEAEQAKVKIVGMETTASCEGGQRWVRHAPPKSPTPPPLEISEPPQEIFLEGALPVQSQLLVADATVETTTNNGDEDDPAVVLAGKMTLSLISPIPPPDYDLLEINGDDDLLTDSKYTTASLETAAEPDISDDEGTDNEENALMEDIEINHNKHDEGDDEE